MIGCSFAGNFSGRELSTEYLFGLYGDPVHPSVVSIPTSYEILDFVAYDNTASAITVVEFKSTITNDTLPVRVESLMEWNDDRQIAKYEVSIRLLGYLIDTLIARIAETAGVTLDEATSRFGKTIATSICQLHDEHCTGANQQYRDSADCLNFLTEKIRLGRDYETGRNTLLCRSIHQIMLPYRPDVHCPHIGPSGGGKCVDGQTYEQMARGGCFANAHVTPHP